MPAPIYSVPAGAASSIVANTLTYVLGVGVTLVVWPLMPALVR